MLYASFAGAESRLLAPFARSQQLGTTDSSHACGGVDLAPGQAEYLFGVDEHVFIDWEVLTASPGCFVLDLSVDEADWLELSVTPHDTSNLPVEGPAFYTAEVHIPADYVCRRCTLRLRQFYTHGDCPPAQHSSENSAESARKLSPDAGAPPLVHYSCANIRIDPKQAERDNSTDSVTNPGASIAPKSAHPAQSNNAVPALASGAPAASSPLEPTPLQNTGSGVAPVAPSTNDKRSKQAGCSVKQHPASQPFALSSVLGLVLGWRRSSR